MQRLPTVNDLRIRECYICREEEVYDKPARPPKRWVHPCKCTLIAHEECLLEWIRASENNPDKPLAGILKCPQCGERYTLESKNPFVLRIMDFGNSVISISGTFVTFLTLGTGVASVATGIYILSAGYGAYAVHQFLGPEMYNLVLGEDIEKWPLCAFLTLPLIPLSLVLSHTKRYRDTLPLVTLMCLWPTVPRINGVQQGRGFLSFLGLGSRTPWILPRIREPASVNKIASDLFKDLLFSWPPSPFVFNIGLGVVRAIYGRVIERFRRFVLGDVPKTGEDEERRGVLLDNFQMEMRIEEGANQQENGNIDAPEEAQEQAAAAAPVNNQADQLQDDNNVRLVLDDAEEGPVAIADQPAEAVPIPVQEQQQPEVPNPEQQRFVVLNPVRPDDDALAGRVRHVNPQPNPDQNQGEDRAANVGARVRLRLTGAFFGNIIGGALIVPPLASLTGSLLLRLALPPGRNAHARLNFRGYSPYSPRRLLCRFLGVRPPGLAPFHPMMGMYAFREDMPTGELIRAMITLSCRALVIGTPAWTDSDPVWWRNTIGLGIFYFTKDMLSVWYQYLSQREIRSRQVQDRAFVGIDPDELDLKPELRGTFSISPVAV